jgi:hypothetical protein
LLTVSGVTDCESRLGGIRIRELSAGDGGGVDMVVLT